MKKQIFLGTLIILITASCHKTANTTNPTPSSGSNGNGPANAGLLCAHTTYDATPSSSGMPASSSYVGEFYSSPHVYINAGTVSANGISIAVTSGPPEYVYYQSSGISGNTHWIVSGNGTTEVPAINYTSKPIVPVYANFDTLHKSRSYTITHAQVNADTIYYAIGDQTNTQLKKYVLGQSSSVTFTQAEMATHSFANSTETIIISTVNVSSSTFGGKNYTFKSDYMFFRYDIPVVN